MTDTTNTPAEDVQTPAPVTPAEPDQAAAPSDAQEPATASDALTEPAPESTPEPEAPSEPAAEPTPDSIVPSGDSPVPSDGGSAEPDSEPVEAPTPDAPTQPETPSTDEVPATPAVPTEPASAAAPEPAPEEPVSGQDSGLSDEARLVNHGGGAGAQMHVAARPVGRMVRQKAVEELEDEIDSGLHKDATAFIKAHLVDAVPQDTTFNNVALALRWPLAEVVNVLRELGVRLPEGA